MLLPLVCTAASRYFGNFYCRIDSRRQTRSISACCAELMPMNSTPYVKLERFRTTAASVNDWVQ